MTLPTHAAPKSVHKVNRMENKVRAAMLHGPEDIRLEWRTITPPEPDEVQVTIGATGLCGSDVHYYKHCRLGAWTVDEPMAQGHEAAGTVAACGSAVTNLTAGDKVALEVGQPCERCARCVEGRYNLCKDMRFRASAKSKPVYQGTLQDRVNAPARWCHKMPSTMPLELGALAEPLSVAIHAMRRAQFATSPTVVIFGAGTIGLLIAAMAKAHHARRVLITDIDQDRLRFALKHSFAHDTYLMPIKTCNKDEEALHTAETTAKDITSTCNTLGAQFGEADVVFECTGVPSCAQAAIHTTRPGGKVVLVGIGKPSYLMPISAAALREVDIVGVFRYANTYQTAIDILQHPPPDMPDIRKLITHRFAFIDEAQKALSTAARTKDDDGKVVLKVMLTTEHSMTEGEDSPQEQHKATNTR